MADDNRYNDRRYRNEDGDRRPRMDERGDYGQADYGGGYRADPRRDEYGRTRRNYGRPDYRDDDRRDDEQRSYAPYGANGPVRTGHQTFDGDGHPARGGYGEEPRSDDGFQGEHESPNVRGGRGQEARTWWNRATDTLSSWLGDDDAQRRHRWDEVRRAEHHWPEGRGDHRGRGPKGYRRSDERIREDVNDRLTDDPYLDATTIEVTVLDSEVTLSGTVLRREDKRGAEILAETVSGVTHVQNNLRLQQGDSGQRSILDPAIGPTF